MPRCDSLTRHKTIFKHIYHKSYLLADCGRIELKADNSYFLQTIYIYVLEDYKLYLGMFFLD